MSWSAYYDPAWAEEVAIGGPDPLNNHKNKRFLSNTGPEHLKTQATIQYLATIGPPAKRHLNGVSLTGL